MTTTADRQQEKSFALKLCARIAYRQGRAWQQHERAGAGPAAGRGGEQQQRAAGRGNAANAARRGVCAGSSAA